MAETSFYFYDLETSGVNARSARIMQFAGQRTSLDLQPIGEPDNILVKLTDDVLPEPDAILITGITPQKTRADGISEAEFLRYFHTEIAVPNTIFVGFNNVRFDDEFMRFANWRNFYDAYEWSWSNNRSRWDLLDVVRMTRALRPEGIEWPVDSTGKATNRLELLTSMNKLDHANAHDALSDVNATIAVADLIRTRQPKLFEYLLTHRDKKKVQELVGSGEPFVYTSGKYPNAYHKTTLAVSLGPHPDGGSALVYDLRRDPDDVFGLEPAEIAIQMTTWTEDETKRFPVKILKYNRCPAVASSKVLQPADYERLSLDKDQIATNLQKLHNIGGLYEKMVAALKILDDSRAGQTELVASELDVDSQLYDGGFLNDQDKIAMGVVRAAEPDDLGGLDIAFKDPRLNLLLPLYKARNYPKSLNADEREAWEKFRWQKLMGGGDKSAAVRFFTRLSELGSGERRLTGEQQYLIEELQLYGQSILPDLE